MDESLAGVYAFVDRFAQNLKSRIVFVRNNLSVGISANIDRAVREYCGDEDIVVDINMKGSLVGKQVFQLINAAYQRKSEVWAVWASYVSYKNNQPLRIGSDKEVKESEGE